MTKKLVTIVGARPQFIKSAPLSSHIANKWAYLWKEIVIHTGQHYDAQLSDIFFSQMEIPLPAHTLHVGSLPHGAQTGRMLEAIEIILQKEQPDVVLVFGDTNSTLAGALAASKMHIPLVHVEAGLRSFNKAMPEEINRILTDHCADLLLAPTETAVQQLLTEGITVEKVVKTGDIMFDAFKTFLPLATQNSKWLNELNLSSKSYILATIHRAENTDSTARIEKIIQTLELLSKQVPVVFPLHPRTKHVLEGLAYPFSESTILFTPPLGYWDMLVAENNAQKIITDSGGVQKEAYWAKVPCFTLRDQTEWVELVSWGANKLISLDVLNVEQMVTELAAPSGPHWDDIPSLYGEGNTAFQIMDAINSRWG